MVTCEMWLIDCSEAMPYNDAVAIGIEEEINAVKSISGEIPRSKSTMEEEGHLEAISLSAGAAADADVVAATAQNNDDDKIAEEKKTADEGPASGGILRSWNHSATPTDGNPQLAPLGTFEDDNVDESPYEHGFEPGDHIIRWEMLPILWPIQINGIVLEVAMTKQQLPFVISE